MKIKTILMLSALSLTGCATTQEWAQYYSQPRFQQPVQQPQTIIVQQAPQVKQPRYGYDSMRPIATQSNPYSNGQPETTTIRPDGIGGWTATTYR